MRPTALELLEKLDDAFRKQVVPLLQDEHAQARAGILTQLIAHLHQRVRLEGECLWQEYAELRQLLGSLAPDLAMLDLPGALNAAAAVIGPEQYPAVPLLAERNEILRAALVRVIDCLDDLPADGRGAAEQRVLAYLRAQLDRDLLLSSTPPLGDAGDGAELPLV